MVASSESNSVPVSKRTTSERKSERELVIRHLFDAPAPLVFEAWTRPELFRQWWVPASSGATLLTCDQDVRVGGSYRLVFAHPVSETPMAFFGRYLEVMPHARLVWTNEESADGQVTTVTFEGQDGQTLLVMSELYPSKEALDTATEGMGEAMAETFAQLDGFIVARAAGTGQG